MPYLMWFGHTCSDCLLVVDAGGPAGRCVEPVLGLETGATRASLCLASRTRSAALASSARSSISRPARTVRTSAGRRAKKCARISVLASVFRLRSFLSNAVGFISPRPVRLSSSESFCTWVLAKAWRRAFFRAPYLSWAGGRRSVASTSLAVELSRDETR